MKRKEYLGFGFKPAEWQNHFYVLIPTGRKASDIISVYERYHWDLDGTQEIRCEEDILKVQMPRSKWRLLAGTVKNEFNGRLKQSRIPVGTFVSGGVPVEKSLGIDGSPLGGRGKCSFRHTDGTTQLAGAAAGRTLVALYNDQCCYGRHS